MAPVSGRTSENLLDAYEAEDPELLADALTDLLAETASDPTCILGSPAVGHLLQKIKKLGADEAASGQRWLVLGPAYGAVAVAVGGGVAAILTAAGAAALVALGIGGLFGVGLIWLGGEIARRKRAWDDVKELIGRIGAVASLVSPPSSSATPTGPDPHGARIRVALSSDEDEPYDPQEPTKRKGRK